MGGSTRRWTALFAVESSECEETEERQRNTREYDDRAVVRQQGDGHPNRVEWQRALATASHESNQVEQTQGHGKDLQRVRADDL